MTMQADEFEDLLRTLCLPDEGQKYLGTVRTCGPARRVRSSRYANCCYHYVSARMGFTLMAESHLEYRALLRCEYNQKDVIEFWDQPTSVPIEGTDKRGRRYRSIYTADILTVGQSGVMAIEIKPYKRCGELCADRPTDWTHRGDEFIYEPARHIFANLGIEHKVVTDKDIGAIEASNYEVLLHARANPPDITAIWRERLVKVLSKERALSIGELLRLLKSEDVTPILFLIQAGVLHADIRSQQLTEINDAWIALDKNTLEQSLEARNKATCAIDPSLRLPIQEVARTKDALVFLSRVKQLNGEIPLKASKRTLRRWRASVRQAGNEASLVPLINKRGNRLSRLSKAHELFLENILKESYLTPDSLPPYGTYGRYVEGLPQAKDESGNPLSDKAPICFKNYLQRLRRLDPVVVAWHRGGKRAANAATPPVPSDERKILSTRSFQRAHIDHCQLKISLVIGESGGKVVRARPWLTAMVDEYTGAILGMSLGLRAPSRRSCALAIRDCAKRWQRLPEMIVVDNGKDFESVYFEACLARLGVHKQSRPPGNPRYGSSIERVFGVVKDEFLSTLRGNMANKREDRGKSSSHKGCYRGKYTLFELYRLVDHYFFKLFNEHASGERLDSPVVMRRESLARFPASGKKAIFDQTFLVLTAIEQSRQHTWDPQRGIRFRHRYYSHPGLRALEHRHAFEVREEPWDEHCIYVRVKSEWLVCYHGSCTVPRFVTPDRMCSTVLWADTNYPRQKQRIARLLARQEQDSLRKDIDAAHAATLRVSKIKVAIDFPAPPKKLSAVPSSGWREQ